MNLPNKLTLMRVILVPVFVLFLLWRLPGTWGEILSRVLAFVFFLSAAITDFFDGKIARSRHLITNFGKFLDPLADKFMVFGAILGFAASDMYREPGVLHMVTTVAGLIVILRELAITSLRLVVVSGEDKTVVAASKLGKMKTGTQCAWIGTAILEPVLFFFLPFCKEWRVLTWATLILMTVMTILSGIDYLKTFKHVIDPRK
ncbi:MAG: CDP-diacylglycerol--glycerol-3-phosphate 3-phosphatidyltransferase [Clostridia bacterium]|nr:CDP-diacylglycerol--glycerol-3-phosphate 3-phosphatidyltransferase [Clostridia bacterium]